MFLYEPIVKSIKDYLDEETFEDYVERIVSPFYGMSKNELELYFDKKFYRTYDLLKSLFRIKAKKIEEFEKAGILIKTIRLEFNNSIKESMSFKQIQFKEIVEEEWEDSTWYGELNRRLFFVIFKADDEGVYFLKKVKFWSIPEKDMDILEQVWADTKRKIQQEDFENFIKDSDKQIGHVRPKGMNAQDLMETSDGTMQKKKSFWLNRSYIKSIVIN